MIRKCGYKQHKKDIKNSVNGK